MFGLVAKSDVQRGYLVKY